MSPPNGRANGSVGGGDDLPKSSPTAILSETSTPTRFSPEQIKQFVALLEVPFDASVIEWRVTNTSNGSGKSRGQVIPYADQRAYTDRLNALFSPAGWTRKYTVHTSANFQRSKDQKTTAKVFVTCELTIFGLGSHSATGEEWTDDDNAGTSAEAQAFKRACSCFGLGRYLYHFDGVWVDLDERKRPKTKPRLTGWATPDGWRQGLRPQGGTQQQSSKAMGGQPHSKADQPSNARTAERVELVHQIECMAKPLGRRLYRGLLKTVAHAWKPQDLQDAASLQKLLSHMQAAERGLQRMDAALHNTGPEALTAILRSLNLKSLDQVDNLETLHKIVLALEASC